MRGLISEFGIVLPQKVAGLRQNIGTYLEDLPRYANQCIGGLLEHAGQPMRSLPTTTTPSPKPLAKTRAANA